MSKIDIKFETFVKFLNSGKFTATTSSYFAWETETSLSELFSMIWDEAQKDCKENEEL